MSYVTFNEIGTPGERRSEANRIIEIFQLTHSLGKLEQHERRFVDEMARGGAVTTKQLYWLRDLKEKCCE